MLGAKFSIVNTLGKRVGDRSEENHYLVTLLPINSTEFSCSRSCVLYHHQSVARASYVIKQGVRAGEVVVMGPKIVVAALNPFSMDRRLEESYWRWMDVDFPGPVFSR